MFSIRGSFPVEIGLREVQLSEMKSGSPCVHVSQDVDSLAMQLVWGHHYETLHFSSFTDRVRLIGTQAGSPLSCALRSTAEWATPPQPSRYPTKWSLFGSPT